MSVEEFAKALHVELTKDGWKEVNLNLLLEIAKGGNASLSDDAYALKMALTKVLKLSPT